MRTGCIALFVLLAAALVAAPAGAQRREVDAKKSKIAFVYKLEKTVLVEGAFPRWRAQVAFDERQLAKSSVRFEIELAAIDTGNSDGDKEARRPRWFDVVSFPRAVFVSDEVRKTGNNRFEAAGKLTIKGKTRDQAIAFVTSAAAAGLAAQGQFVIKRLEFGVGDGPWADLSQIADEVEVRFNLFLGPPG